MTLLYILIALLLAADSALTAYALHRFPGKVEEGNGILAKLMSTMGRNTALILTKLGLFGLLLVLHLSDVYLAVIAVLYAAVVAWNVYVIARKAWGG